MKASILLIAGLTILSTGSANSAPKAAAAPPPATKVSSVACSVSGGGFGTYPSDVIQFGQPSGSDLTGSRLCQNL